MNRVVLEIWHDLRAKRLWPLAAVLVVALVAVPLVVKKQSSPASVPAAPPATSASSGEDTAKTVVVADNDISKNSTLGVFNKKDPFKPDKAELAKANPPAPKAPTTTSPQPAPPSGGSPGPASGGGTPGGSGIPTGSSPTGGGVVIVPKPIVPKAYAYTIDVRFGKLGETRIHHNLQKLDVLPNQNNPLLVFLGVNSAGDTAVFLTDTSLKAAGEGTCKPNGDTCSFLYLKLGENHDSEDLSALHPDGTGTEYRLKLVAIHKVPVSELVKNAKKAAAAAREAAHRARVLEHKAPTPFRVPLKLQLQPDGVGGAVQPSE